MQCVCPPFHLLNWVVVFHETKDRATIYFSGHGGRVNLWMGVTLVPRAFGF